MFLFSVRNTWQVQRWIVADFRVTVFASLVYKKGSERRATMDNCYHLYFISKCFHLTVLYKMFFPKVGSWGVWHGHLCQSPSVILVASLYHLPRCTYFKTELACKTSWFRADHINIQPSVVCLLEEYCLYVHIFKLWWSVPLSFAIFSGICKAHI